CSSRKGSAVEEKTKRSVWLKLAQVFRRNRDNKRPSCWPGLALFVLRGSAPQQGLQALRHRFVEHVVVERVQQILPAGFAGDKIADVAIYGRNRGPRPLRQAFYGEMRHNWVFSCTARVAFPSHSERERPIWLRPVSHR